MLRLEKVCRRCKIRSEECRKCSGCDIAWYCSKECQKDDWRNHKANCGKAPKEEGDDLPQTRCGNCSGWSSDIKRCAGCYNISYCCKECQTNDWPYHKSLCKGKDKPVEIKENDPISTGTCGFCKKTGCSLRCTRCKEVHYCSKECQRKHWKIHKATDCKDQRNGAENTITFNTDMRGRLAPLCSLVKELSSTPELERIVAKRPPGSLEKVKAIARRRFHFSPIIDDLDEVPQEVPFPFLRQAGGDGCVLVGFMFKYHPHVVRHAIYIQDKKDEVTTVMFYLDHDNPFPFFSYSQVKPGNFLCLLNPMMHYFMDGTVGIRVDDPSDVYIIDGQAVF